MKARCTQTNAAGMRTDLFRSRVGVAVLRRVSGRFLVMVLLGLALLWPAGVRAAVDVTETWSGGDTAGWTNDPSISKLSNPGGFLGLEFTNQASPAAEADIVYSGLAGVMPVAVSFRFSTADTYPSAVRLCMHCSSNDNVWYVTLARPEVGTWTDYSVPVNFDEAGWVNGPESSKAQFNADMQGINWIGVYVRRHGSTAAQKYGIDDMRIQGADGSTRVAISGLVGYDGELDGIVRVLAQWDAGSAETNMVGPGNYTLTDLPALKTMTVTAYMDSNANSTQEFWEAAGAYEANPLTVGFVDIPNVDIAMSDPKNLEGLPFWWLNEYFDLEGPGASAPGAGDDGDGDGMSNYAEWRAGTNPTNPASVFDAQMVGGAVFTNLTVVEIDGVPYDTETKQTTTVRLRWGSIKGRTYRIMYTDNIKLPLVPLYSGIVATPPFNEQEFDVTTLPAGGRFFFRVKVE